MAGDGHCRPIVERACNTEPEGEEARRKACNDIVDLVNQRTLSVLNLAILLAGPLTSPEKEARENGTRLLGEVVLRCRSVLSEGELHTLAEFLAARLKDWPCLGPAAAACRSLLQDLPSSAGDVKEARGGGGGSGVIARLRDESAGLVLVATAEMLRSAQSFRQDERSALLQLLLTAVRRWGGVASRLNVPLLDAFLGAADGEKDPRCLLLAFDAVTALCEMHHAPGVDAAPLRLLADEVADWASSYFPISFNPPPSMARGPNAITRADLSASLESALAASPFLAGAVLPLLVEKLSSTYRPSKEDSLAALKRCCPAYGADALKPHLGQLWQALRTEVMAPCGHGGGMAAVPPGAGGGAAGSEMDSRLAMATSAASCMTVVVRAAGAGVMGSLALQDACVGDLLSVVRAAGSPTHGSSAQAVARADAQVLCGSMVLAAIAAAGPASLSCTHAVALAQVETALAESLAPPSDGYGSRVDQTLYSMAVLTTVVDAVAAEIRPVHAATNGTGCCGDVVAPAFRAWLVPSASEGLVALADLKNAMVAALAPVHARLLPRAENQTNAFSADHSLAALGASDTVDTATPDAMKVTSQAAAEVTGQYVSYSAAVTAQLQMAAVSSWGALLRLHAAASAAAGASDAGADATLTAAGMKQLMLTEAELMAASEQLCSSALAAGSVTGSLTPMRMRWGRRINPAQEAATALQTILQLQHQLSSLHHVDVGSDPAGAVSAQAPLVQLLVTKLAEAMATSGGGSIIREGAAASRAAALHLAVLLTQAKEQGELTATEAKRSDSTGREGAVAFAAALLRALPPLLLKQAPGEGDEEWLKDCLTQLATRVLPPLALSSISGCALRDTDTAATAAASQKLQPSATAATAVAAAAHRLVLATLEKASDWDLAGGSGLPFRVAAEEAAAAPLTHGSLASAQSPLMEAWCAAVQKLTACCDDRQQLDLAMEAADRIAAGSTWASSLAAGGSVAEATTPIMPACEAGVALSCAVVAGMRVGVLAAQSTQALSDSLLRLLVTAPSVRLLGGAAAATSTSTPSRIDHMLEAAAVALAAVVNRWQDAASLETWLRSAFQPALLQRLISRKSLDNPDLTSSDSIPAATVVKAVGWVGRALGLRNHSTLQAVVGALLAWLKCEWPTSQPTENRAVSNLDAAAIAAVTEGISEAVAMDVDVGVGVGMGAVTDVTTAGSEASLRKLAAVAAGLAAADVFGLLAAEEVAAGGVSLTARPNHALCRVLWQQRTYSLCMQALEAECHLHQRQQHQQQGSRITHPLPLPMAMAVARLAGSAPSQLCRMDAIRVAPLLLRSVKSLCRALRGPVAVPWMGSSAALAVKALREALAVIRDWLQGPKDTLYEQLEKVLQDQVHELVDCACAAAEVGAGPPPGRRGALHPAALPPSTSPSPQVDPPADTVTTLPPLDATLAAAVREESLRCCSGLVDMLPYHMLHPLRRQVLSCVMRRLDDNRRSVRQLAIQVWRAWGDT